jgi:hypothetical protein
MKNLILPGIVAAGAWLLLSQPTTEDKRVWLRSLDPNSYTWQQSMNLMTKDEIDVIYRYMKLTVNAKDDAELMRLHQEMDPVLRDKAAAISLKYNLFT